MTFSIVACDLEEKSWGVAVASKFPAVGAVVPMGTGGCRRSGDTIVCKHIIWSARIGDDGNRFIGK